jgi:fumarate reductase subunit C
MTAPEMSRRAYRTKPSVWWWTSKRSYTLFALRELSSVFVAWLVVFMLLLVWSVSQGPQRYGRFLDVASNPLLVVLNVVALAFLLLHTVTWFNLTPKAMPIKVPAAVIVAGQWAGFVVVSGFVVWLVVS